MNSKVSHATSPKILVVDDDKTLRRLLNSLLTKEGYTVVEAAEGQSALKIAFSEKIDLILLDIQMPLLNGFEVCRSLKDNFRTSNIPVIFLTGETDKEKIIEGLDAGAADYLTKLFHKGELLARVRTQLRIQSLVQELAKANNELREKQARLTEDLTAAACIQRGLLPDKGANFKRLNIAWRLLPSELVAGDIFNIIQLDEQHIAIYMVDVCDKGVPASIMTVSISQLLQPFPCGIITEQLKGGGAVKIVSPKNVLHKLDHIYPLDRFGQYFTIVYMVINTETGKLIYSQAAHPSPYLISKEGNLEALRHGGPIIGFGDSMPFEEHERDLQFGDKVVLYTDGLIDYQDISSSFYGKERLCTSLTGKRNDSCEDLVDRVVADFTNFGNAAPLMDDASLLIVEYNGSDAL